MSYLRITECILCGAPIEHTSWRSRKVVCENCARIRKRRQQQEYRKNSRSLRNEEKEQKEKKPAETPKKSLDQMAREARALHLTYGQYSALIASGGLERYCKDHGIKTPK